MSLLSPTTTVLLPVVLGTAILLPVSPATAAMNPELKVGVVQRFGSPGLTQMTLAATAGDRLTLQFAGETGVMSLQVPSVQLVVQMQPLAEPRVEERLVLSSHRSFESAEASAAEWQARGIQTDVGQPKTWEVWADRDTYHTPLLRRLLLQSLQANDLRLPTLKTEVITQIPQVTWMVGGKRYTQSELAITSGKSLIRVLGVSDRRPDRLYAGSMRLQPNAYGSFTLVNQVPVETYLRGVVPHEIGPSAPQSAVETQAILARTYALRNLRRFAIDNYELCADTQCQVYWGLSDTVPRSDRAIAATRGLVLTYQNELVDAVYSSTTGGITAPFHDVWNGAERPYLRAVVDSVANIWDLSRRSLADETNFRAFIQKRQGFNEVGWRTFRWRIPASLATLNHDLKQYLQAKRSDLANFRTIQQLAVVQRSPAGRVLKLQVVTDQGTLELQKDEILRAFDPPNSTLFYLEPMYLADGNTLNGYAFVGGGLGHGVGLSQTGSYRLADLGWSYGRILSFYYPGTQLQPLNPSIAFWRGSN